MASEHDVPVDLYIAAYSDPNAAQADWDDIKELAKEKVITVDALVLVSRDDDGKIHVKDNAHDVGVGTALGAVGGLLIGLIFPPAFLASGVVGAGIGAGIGGLVSHHEKKEIKAEVEDTLPPGSSGIVALFEERWLADVEKALAKRRQGPEARRRQGERRAGEGRGDRRQLERRPRVGAAMAARTEIRSDAPVVPGAPPAFHLLSKPTGAVCNLDCAYCFFLSKEMLYPGSRFRMADDLLEAYIRQLIEAHGRVPEVQIAWQGGEPTLMGVEFFRRSVELAQRYLKPGQRAVYTIQTNGTLLDEEWTAFFKENEFLVGISIDGPQELHDAYRVNKGGKGSFDQVMHGLDQLKAAGVEWNALTTIHAANAGHGLRCTASCATSAERGSYS